MSNVPTPSGGQDEPSEVRRGNGWRSPGILRLIRLWRNAPPRIALAMLKAVDVIGQAVRAECADASVGSSTPGAVEPKVFLNFSANKQTRPVDGKLPPSLFIRVLERLSRFNELPLEEFESLLRSREPAVPRAKSPPDDPEKGARHEVTELRRWIGKMDPLISVEYRRPRIIARFDLRRVDTNVMSARRLLRKGIAHYKNGDLADTAKYAAEALEKDFDSQVAAWVVARLVASADCELQPETVLRAETCVARGMIRCAAAVERFRRVAENSIRRRAANRVEHLLAKRFPELWKVLGNFKGPERTPQTWLGSDAHVAYRALVEMAVRLKCGDRSQSTYDEFAANRIISQVLGQRVKRLGSALCVTPEAAANLRMADFARFALDVWMPDPVTFEADVHKQLDKFFGDLHATAKWGSDEGRSRNAPLPTDLSVEDGRRHIRSDADDVDPDDGG